MTDKNNTKEEEELRKAWLERLARKSASSVVVIDASTGRKVPSKGNTHYVYDSVDKAVKGMSSNEYSGW